MLLLQHLCGQTLERAAAPSSAYYHLISLRNCAGCAQQVQRCPRCHELLLDTDMLDSTGMPLIGNLVSEQSRARRAVLAGLTSAGFALRWEDGSWYVWPLASDQDTLSSDTLDTIIAQASAIIWQQREAGQG
jgi:hypothetical protein